MGPNIPLLLATYYNFLDSNIFDWKTLMRRMMACLNTVLTFHHILFKNYQIPNNHCGLQHYVAAFCIISHFDEPEIYGKRDLLRGQSVVIIIMRGDIRFHAQELRNNSGHVCLWHCFKLSELYLKKKYYILWESTHTYFIKYVMSHVWYGLMN